MNAKDFSINLSSILAPDNHLAVSSGYGTVHPIARTVCGVGECFSPPFAGRNLKLELEWLFDGHRAVDDGNYGKGDCGLLYAGGEWRPDSIVRRGTYHHRVENKIISVEVESRLAALADQPGAILEVKVRNRSGRRISLQAQPKLQPGDPAIVPLDDWGYRPPEPGMPARSIDAHLWENGTVSVHLLVDETRRAVESGAETVFYFAVVLTRPSDSLESKDWQSWLEQTEIVWDQRLKDVSSRVPLVQSSIPGLSDFYRRSLISGLVCIWEKEEFACNPFLATSGMDGGAICGYAWDTCAYAPQSLCLLLGDRISTVLDLFEKSDIIQHTCLAPSGKGFAVPYAYNACSMLTLLRAAATHRGLTDQIFEYARHTFEQAEERLQIVNELADFGRQENLLEMRGLGWEHFVASPNAERAWCLEQLADMADALGLSGGKKWRRQACEIHAAIREHLWNRGAGWFDCLHPDGHREQVLSIQAFDALRHGCCSAEMESALLSHLRDGAFLGNYGVSSVSREDRLHYELNDPDWSGGGSYFGDGLNLAQTLWELGHAKLAWDILERYFWMGKHLPYYPQEAFCDRPAVPAHKRANIIAGLAGLEAILFGMLGIKLNMDGTCSIQPAAVLPEGTIELHGLELRGRQLEVTIDRNSAVLAVDGQKLPTTKPGERVTLF